jgi:hypothetical protein
MDSTRVTQFGSLVVIVILTACGSGMGRPGTGQTDPCNAYTCDGHGAQVNVAYRYQLPTHCGVLETQFDGRLFYVESLYPSDLPPGLDGPTDLGTMTLLGAHLALFQDAAGHSIRFVDSPPGVIGRPYPFTAHVLAGGNTLIDEHFAGRLWHPQGTLPGVSGPPYGNGHDAYTTVSGNISLVSDDLAVFTAHGTTVNFVRSSFACM